MGNVVGMGLTIVLCAAATVAAAAGPAFQQRGGRLVDAAGLTVYSYDKDPRGSSACYAQCATLWPPAYAAADAQAHGDLAPIARTDGRRQWALRGKPLYYWLADKKPGDASGDGVNGIWHVVH